MKNLSKIPPHSFQSKEGEDNLEDKVVSQSGFGNEADSESASRSIEEEDAHNSHSKEGS